MDQRKLAYVFGFGCGNGNNWNFERLGGALKVSQTQLVQPFFSILAAVPLLGEPLETVTLGFALAVVATVFIGRRFGTPAQLPGVK